MFDFTQFWHAIGHQLSRPSGIRGRLLGHVMAYVNEQPNREAIQSLDIGPSDIILELGFGPGRAIETLVSKTPHGKVFGIDPSEEMVAQASRTNRRWIDSGRVRLMQGYFNVLPWQSGTIDKILAVNVVYFFHESGAELREARRLLKPGGEMAIYATDKSSMSQWKFAGPETHLLFDRDGLTSLIIRGGFGVDEFFIREIAFAYGVIGLIATLRKRSSAFEFADGKGSASHPSRENDDLSSGCH
jgi:SAM-dependent methyltransferase